MTRLTPFLLILALMLVAVPAASGAPPVPKLDWEACDPGFECATAEVPRDYSRPHGEKIDLALIRRPASDRENRIGSLFFNPGGPGGSGVDLVRGAPPAALAAFGRLYDLVGFDPRGVGLSRPAVRGCSVRFAGNTFMRQETLDVGLILGNARDQIGDCAARSGGVLPYLTTGNVARDLDLLRAAVGDEKLNYVGISYGTAIGATYTSLFPGRTGRLVLDSPVDTDVWLNRPADAIREQLASFERSLARFLHWCSRRPAICSLDPDDPDGDLEALVARLNDAPLPAPQGEPVTGDEILVTAESTLRSKFWWADYAAAISQAKAGDGSAMSALLESFSSENEPTGAFFAYLANETRHRGGATRYLEEMEHNEGMSEHFWWARGYEWIGLSRWPFRPNGVYRGPFRHAAGARAPLVVASTYDPATPYRWAKRYVADLGNARLLTYRADGHGAITELNPCVTVAILTYVNEGALPPPGATCTQQVPEPAAAAIAGRSSRHAAWKRITASG